MREFIKDRKPRTNTIYFTVYADMYFIELEASAEALALTILHFTRIFTFIKSYYNFPGPAISRTRRAYFRRSSNRNRVLRPRSSVYSSRTLGAQ